MSLLGGAALGRTIDAEQGVVVALAGSRSSTDTGRPSTRTCQLRLVVPPVSGSKVLPTG
ncbi:hypothetical protein [Fodinicola feengrottensis]|uniref:hypothetical protein n=1 Tax=Fodinicola feengrottensis TaxID=435914 RepID=UPI0013D04C80|nr:hypothetical protein [Fodinicola feengrottensis]